MTARRLFTVERANRTLPFVKRVVDDLVGKHDEYRRLMEAREKQPEAERERTDRRLFDLEGELERHSRELETIGCELKDPARGLLDFPARRGQQAILLCWMKGEESVAWWHPLETGFGGRRPVSELPQETLRGPPSPA